MNNFRVDPALREVVDSMSRKSPTFASLVAKLRVASGEYAIRLGKLPIKTPALTLANLVCSGAITIVDLAQIKKLRYQTATGSKGLMTLERVIGHELSHSLYHEHLPLPFDRIAPHSFFIRNENKIMREIAPSSLDRNEKNDILYTS
jgi:hypothetical protein